MDFPGTFRVVIAHQHPPLAVLVRERLGAEPGLDICGLAYTAAALRVLTQSFQPDILVIDAHFEAQGLDALLRSFQETAANRWVVLLTTGKAATAWALQRPEIVTVPTVAIATQLLPALRRITGRSQTTFAPALPTIGLGRPPR